MRFWRDMRLAFSLLTGVPVAAEWPVGERTQVAAFFPWVGLAVGTLGYLLALGASVLLSAQPLLPAALIVLALGAFTRFLHWDAVADVGDAFLVAPEKRLDVMSDSRTGAFGVVAIVFVALLETLAISALIQNAELGIILLAPVFGRLAATFGAWLGKPARPGGLGASVAGRPTVTGVVVALAPVAVVSAGWLAFEPRFAALAIFLGVVLALTVPHTLGLRFGGITGDVLGASVLHTETILLVLAALAVSILSSNAIPNLR